MFYFLSSLVVLAGGSFLLDRSGGELGLGVGSDGLNLVGDINLTLAAAHSERADHRDYQNEGYKALSDFLKDVSGLTHTESLVAGDKVAGHSIALAVLKEHDGDKQNRCEHDEHGQDDKYYIHILSLFCFLSISSIRDAK